ncbi:MAG: flavin reductase family protein [Symbiobacteriaceae bacterium]|nr:flavin reductase family protein [Symbiobacteriaceae bacterium]
MPESLLLPHINDQLQQLFHQGGAFLTSYHNEKLNTMTIGWGSLGYIWSLPIFTAAVRSSRYSYQLLEASLEFTITIPQNDSFREALHLCGTKSGRDLDKIKAANLTTQPSQKIATPIIAGAAWQYECRVVYRQAMEASLILLPALKERLYNPQQDSLHTIYYGEILAAYETK